MAEAFPGKSSDDREAVRALTALIEDGLGAVAPTWESPEHRAAARSAAMHELPVGASLAAIESEAERLAAVGPLPEPDPRVVGERGEASLLVPPAEIDAVDSALVWPFAVVGKLANRPPFMAVDAIANAQKSNIRATVKVGAGAVLYPLWWLFIALAARRIGMSWNAEIATAGSVAALGALSANELPVSRA